MPDASSDSVQLLWELRVTPMPAALWRQRAWTVWSVEIVVPCEGFGHGQELELSFFGGPRDQGHMVEVWNRWCGESER